MANSRFHQTQNAFIFENALHLTKAITPFLPTDKNFNVVTNCIMKNIKEHKFSDLSPFKVKAEYAGIIDKFRQNSNLEIASQLEMLWNKLMMGKSSNRYDVPDLKYSNLQILLSLSDSPLNTTYDPITYQLLYKRQGQANEIGSVIEQFIPSNEEMDQWKGTDSENSELTDQEEVETNILLKDDTIKQPDIILPSKYKDESTNVCFNDEESNTLDILGIRKDPPIERTKVVISSPQSENLLNNFAFTELPSIKYTSYLKELYESKNSHYFSKTISERELIQSLLLMLGGYSRSLISVHESGEFEYKFRFEVNE